LPRDAHAAPDGQGCTRCQGIDLPFARCFAPFLYAAPLDGLVQDLKYGGALANARVLGTLLGHSVRSFGLHLDVDLVVPMPLHTSRLLERGYNQSHEIARFAAREVGKRCAPHVLRRHRSTSPQVGLTREARAANVAGAFLADRDQVAGRRVALIDDVVTTGSTARAAAEQLRTAGAFTVDVWSVARVPGGYAVKT
jgi:ComF family protein